MTMRIRNLLLATVLMAGAHLSDLSVPTAAAQTIVAEQSAAFLAPVDGSGGINSPALFATAEAGASAAGVFKADVDLMFLQPLFPGRAVRLRVPSPSGAILGDTSDLSDDFCFSPGVQVGYEFANTNFGVVANGRMLHLTGRIDRTIHDTAGAAIATASAQSTVDLAVANPVEGFVTVPLLDFMECHHDYLRESLFTVSIGARYAHVQQYYTSTVVTGPDHQGSLTANQTFNGFGLTSAVAGVYPIKERWALYSTTRGSVLFGTNQRDNSITIVAPGANSGSKASEEATTVVPVAELELGVMYGLPIGNRVDSWTTLWLKSGFVGQFWGELGLLEINNAPGHQFEDSPLWLVGFSVQIGIDY